MMEKKNPLGSSLSHSSTYPSEKADPGSPARPSTSSATGAGRGRWRRHRLHLRPRRVQLFAVRGLRELVQLRRPATARALNLLYSAAFAPRIGTPFMLSKYLL